MQTLAAGLKLAAHNYRDRTLQPTPQVRNVPAPARLRRHARALRQDPCQMAAIEELFGDVKECERRYMSAQVLLHSLTGMQYKGGSIASRGRAR
ncbi:unnamed protein product [Leptidea sinapis]|uniref:Uncharacterized protein n=1 Tax=Leptidea sinapis TaxID=189913 RepID=A0A5E4PNM4_9NEOP|nr:unnamed protein product [Leptidea sinapis]